MRIRNVALSVKTRSACHFKKFNTFSIITCTFCFCIDVGKNIQRKEKIATVYERWLISNFIMSLNPFFVTISK